MRFRDYPMLPYTKVLKIIFYSRGDILETNIGVAVQ